jgi:hypothetical protein
VVAGRRTPHRVRRRSSLASRRRCSASAATPGCAATRAGPEPRPPLPPSARRWVRWLSTGPDVFDAGDVVVEDELEAGQARRARHFGTARRRQPHRCAGRRPRDRVRQLPRRGRFRAVRGKRLGVLNLDAHFDLRDEATPSSGTPFLQMAHAEAAAGRELKYAVVGISEPNNTGTLQHRRRAGREVPAG